MPTSSFEPPVSVGLEIPCIWVPDGCDLRQAHWPNACVFSAIWVPDDDFGTRPGHPWIELGRMALPSEPETAPVPAEGAVMPPWIGLPAGAMGTHGHPVAMPSGEPTEGTPQAVSGRLTVGPVAPGLEPTANGSRTGYAHRDIGAAMEAWNALSDLRSVRAALDATSPITSVTRAQNSLVKASARAGSTARVADAAPQLSTGTLASYRALHPLARAGLSGFSPPDARRGIQRAAAPNPGPPVADLLSDELRGGHTIERHVGKTEADLARRLSGSKLDAVSTYHDLGEATAVTQQALDANRKQISLWLADPAMSRRLVVTLSRPVTSSQYAP
jgi:Bacterial CdiA-CT RNAse A domain